VGKDDNCIQNLVEKSLLVSINLHRRPRRRWEGGIILDSEEVVCENGKWMQLALDHVQ
jgi:hypothetical protein